MSNSEFTTKPTFTDHLKNLMKNKIVLAVAAIVFGVILLIKRSEGIASLVRIMGIILLVVAAILIIRNFLNKKENITSFLIIGIICAAVGLLFVAAPRLIVDIFPFLMGALLLISGVDDLVRAINMVKNSAMNASVFVGLAVLIIVLGALILFHPGVIADLVVVMIGITMIIEGVVDFVVLMGEKKAEKMTPTEIYEVEPEE